MDQQKTDVSAPPSDDREVPGPIPQQPVGIGASGDGLALTARTALHSRLAQPILSLKVAQVNAMSTGTQPETSLDLAAILDQKEPIGREFVFVRRGQKLTVQPAQPAASRESDAEWYARMRGYFARKRGEASPEDDQAEPLPAAPTTRQLSDKDWYAQMRGYLAAKKATETPEPKPEDKSLGDASEDRRNNDEVGANAAKTGDRRGEAVEAGRLTIGRYLSNYLISDGSPLPHIEQDRLDAISHSAVEACERELGPLLAIASRLVLPSLQVDLSADFSVQSDEEIAEDWGLALARAIRASLRRGIPELGPSSRPG